MPSNIYDSVSGPISLISGYENNCASDDADVASHPVKQKIT